MLKDSFDIEECMCDCHRSDNYMKHCIPCCITCKKCGKRIKMDFYGQHDCQGTNEKDPIQELIEEAIKNAGKK
jgi:hypothetical protein